MAGVRRPPRALEDSVQLVHRCQFQESYMDELLSWLRQQKGGVGTHAEFRERALALREREPEHAAAARLLADLAGRLADAYDEERFPTDMAARALGRLTALVEKVVRLKNAGASERLALLNEIGVAELV
jgi:hypothetical protein